MRPSVRPDGPPLLPSPRTPRLVPMTWAAAWAWVQAFNAAVEAAHERCRRGETFEAMQVDWVDGHFVHDSAVPGSCFNFGPAGNGAPLGHVMPATRWERFGPVPGAPRGRSGWRKLPVGGPEDVRWAGWRKSRHWRQGGAEPLPHDRGGRPDGTH